MNLSDEIRKQIEKNKELKLAVGEINNHLSVLEGLTRKDIMEQVDEAYQKGYDKGYVDKTNNDEVCKQIAKDIQDEAYQRGLDDAWKLAEDVLYNRGNVLDILRCATVGAAFDKYSAGQALDILKAYEEKQKADDEIKVGDEVRSKRGWTAVVVKIDDDGLMLMDSSGAVGSYSDISKFTKTGRHFDINKILEEMKA